jgi:hypothetical protein
MLRLHATKCVPVGVGRKPCAWRTVRLLAVRCLLLAASFLGVLTAAASGPPVVSAGATASTFHFRSPSGNIQCRMDAVAVSCLLTANRWRHLKPKPSSFDVDWVPTDMAMFLDRRTGRWKVQVGGCRGDVGPLCYRADPCSLLRYGRSLKSVTFGAQPRGLRCTSATNGITCTKIGRNPGARGFRVAREGYALF